MRMLPRPNPKAQGGGKLNPPPVNVLAAVNPINCPDNVRSELLPYLALGFTPVFTSAGANLCAIHALANGLRAVKEALDIPVDPRGHITTSGLRRQLASPKWIQKITAHVDIVPDLEKPLRDQHIAYYSAKEFLDVNHIDLLLQLVNDVEKTNFCLGVVTRGYVTKKKVVPTTVYIYNDGTGTQPVIWLHNDNATNKFSDQQQEAFEEAESKGDPGANVASAYEDMNIANHWEAFGIPAEDAQETKRRNVVRDWNFGPEIVEDVAKGVWRTTISNLSEPLPPDMLAYDRGQFLRDTPAPRGADIPNGFRYMVSPAPHSDKGRRRGLVPEDDIVRIELHPKAPTEAVDLDPAEPVVDGLFRIYRGVESVERFGSTSPDAKPQVRNGFKIRAGEFLYDLQQRDGNWIRVRRATVVRDGHILEPSKGCSPLGIFRTISPVYQTASRFSIPRTTSGHWTKQTSGDLQMILMGRCRWNF
ncbi:hypothetical protein ONS95_004282 [Cadophora gregata]|uniref:uncharacterized protein n=1 Tax=Cadophora gregata TaxID=51156 RepID=UPI0026DCD9D0|nr:uncharacterized protein ONS95_004282 [Cadophora gregata]KAK0105763.1 hypothetical protein ONS95_004282 [Cadophora gregata]